MSGRDEISLKMRADVRLGGSRWRLRVEVASGPKLEFTLKQKDGVELSDMANALYARFTDVHEPLFDKRTFPAIVLKRLKLSYEDAPSAAISSSMKFETVLELGRPSDKRLIEKLGFLFAKIEPKPDGGQSYYLAGIRSQGSISLVSKDSGVIGQLLGDVALEKLGLFYASQTIDAFRFADGDKAQAVPSGLSVALGLKLRQSNVDISLSSAGLELFPSGAAAQPALPAQPAPAPPGRQPPPPTPQPVKPAKAELTGGTRYWKDLNKTLGPLQLRRIGGEWISDQGRLGILLDAAISLAGLTVGLSGLSVNVEPQKLTSLSFSDLGFKLDGMALDFQRGPISISGMLLKGQNDAYSGKAMIRAATFSIGAIGAYGRTKQGESSFFIFGAFTGILGGPPCFVVQGIAAGFGYNRAIALPEIDKVREFPLVELILPKPPSTLAKAFSSANTSDIPADYDLMFPPTSGQYWIAAGVYFSSFKLIETFALLTVQFGARLEIALLGVATLQQPPKVGAGDEVPPFIVVEMAIKVRFAPDDGLLSVMAVLTANSFLFDRSCKLTGGFAFCVWFPPTNPNIENHAGDFVLTLGGYHPKFNVPAWYPKVPRIGFDWQLPEFGVSITGEAYFALTPSFIMAGARLSAVFRSGNFSAWFIAYADFLIGWAPLQYQAEMGVRIGAAFVLHIFDIAWTLSFEISAMLRIWGPPFAGEAYVDLGIVAFTVPIGDRSASREPLRLNWAAFKTQFLPEKPLRITITSGMVEERNDFILVNPSELCLSVESFVPISRGFKGWQKSAVAPALGIRPMGEKKLNSSLSLKWSQTPGAVPELAYRNIIKNLPEALWSPDPAPDARTAAELKAEAMPNVPMGVEVLPRECKQVPIDVVVHEIRTPAIPVPPRSWQKKREEREPYSEKNPAIKRDLFRDNLKRPKADVIEAMQSAGFTNVSAETVKVERIFNAGDPTSIWLAAPTMVQMGKLPPAPAGA